MRGLLAILTIVSCLAIPGCGRSRADQSQLPGELTTVADPGPVEVRVLEVQNRRIEAPFEAIGNLVPLKRSVVYTQVDGTVRSVARSPRPLRVVVDGRPIDYPLSVDIGVPVRKGDVVIQLERRPYELAVQEAEKRLARARRELEQLLAWQRPEEVRQLKAAVRAAEAELKLEQSTLERYRRLREQGAVSEEEFQRQQTRVRLAAARLDQLSAQLAIAEAGPTAEQIAVARAAVEQAEAALELAQYRLERTTVRAPYDGVITEFFVAEGEHVLAAPRTKLFEIVMDQILVAQVNVPERYLGLISPGDRVTLRVVNRNEPFEGTVAFVNGKVDHLTRTFRVRIGVDNRKREFKPGQYVRVRFQLRAPEPAPVVPVTAIRYEEGDPVVYVVQAGVAQRRRLQLGLRSDTQAQVVGGLRAGELVVVDPVELVADGMPVRVVARDEAVAGPVAQPAGETR